MLDRLPPDLINIIATMCDKNDIVHFINALRPAQRLDIIRRADFTDIVSLSNRLDKGYPTINMNYSTYDAATNDTSDYVNATRLYIKNNRALDDLNAFINLHHLCIEFLPQHIEKLPNTLHTLQLTSYYSTLYIYPNVKRLMIQKNVRDLTIINKTYPNITHITSQNQIALKTRNKLQSKLEVIRCFCFEVDDIDLFKGYPSLRHLIINVFTQRNYKYFVMGIIKYNILLTVTDSFRAPHILPHIESHSVNFINTIHTPRKLSFNSSHIKPGDICCHFYNDDIVKPLYYSDIDGYIDYVKSNITYNVNSLPGAHINSDRMIRIIKNNKLNVHVNTLPRNVYAYKTNINFNDASACRMFIGRVGSAGPHVFAPRMKLLSLNLRKRDINKITFPDECDVLELKSEYSTNTLYARIKCDVCITHNVAVPNVTANTIYTNMIFPFATGTRNIILDKCYYESELDLSRNTQLEKLYIKYYPRLLIHTADKITLDLSQTQVRTLIVSNCTINVKQPHVLDTLCLHDVKSIKIRPIGDNPIIKHGGLFIGNNVHYAHIAHIGNNADFIWRADYDPDEFYGICGIDFAKIMNMLTSDI